MTEEKSWQMSTIEQLHAVAASLLNFAGETRIFLFSGEMGAGKTTLIKSLCGVLGSSSHLSSPTYSIVNEYEYKEGKIFHFDLYRVRNISELYDLGMEEYLDSGNYCFIEWPEIAKELFEENYIQVSIKVSEHTRLVSCTRVS